MTALSLACYVVDLRLWCEGFAPRLKDYETSVDAPRPAQGLDLVQGRAGTSHQH
jgi:hypothetical protein